MATMQRQAKKDRGLEILTEYPPSPAVLKTQPDQQVFNEWYYEFRKVLIRQFELIKQGVGGDTVVGPPTTQVLNAWDAGPNAPLQTAGNNGDFYFQTTTQDVWRKVDGAWKIIANLRGTPGRNGTPGKDGTDGEPGLPGTPGSGQDGEDGVDGVDGATWNSGAGVPSDGLGKDGDYYLNTTNGNVYKRQAGHYVLVGNIRGPQGLQGDPGNNGANGATWFNGDGMPGVGIGANGDRYLDDLTGDVFKKVAGVWVYEANIRGPQGLPGSGGGAGSSLVGCMVYKASGTESIANGGAIISSWDSEVFDTNSMHDPLPNPSRITIRTAGKYFAFGSVAWTANGTGARGVSFYKNGVLFGGDNLPAVGAAPTTLPGVYIYDLAVGDYLEMFAAQSSGAALTLTHGQKGTWFAVIKIGEDGLDGATWSSGTAVPNGGAAGDFYLQTTTEDVWKNIDGVWTVITNIKGPKGDAGITGNDGPAGPGYKCTATSASMAIGTGVKTLVLVPASHAYTAGCRARFSSAASPGNWMEGEVTVAAGASVTINADLVSGSGSFTSWRINLAGERGATGPSGSGGGIKAMLLATTGQSIPASTETVVAFPTEIVSYGGMSYDPAEKTITVQEAGLYLVTLGVTIQPGADSAETVRLYDVTAFTENPINDPILIDEDRTDGVNNDDYNRHVKLADHHYFVEGTVLQVRWFSQQGTSFGSGFKWTVTKLASPAN